MPSSVIRSFVYDAAACRLTIRFVSGRVYTYAGVPADVVRGLAGASSSGSFFNAMIRNQFVATRVRGG
jgi:hypothetical protein